jgi:hypothetical protein
VARPARTLAQRQTKLTDIGDQVDRLATEEANRTATGNRAMTALATLGVRA